MKELVRTNTETGAVLRDGSAGTVALRRQRLAWCCTDNLGMSRKDASATANAWDGKSPIEVGAFRFEVMDR